MKSLVVERKLKASLENVWSVIGDFTRSPDPSQRFETEVQGDADNYDIGCIRRIVQGNRVIRERLESAEPPNSLTYVMLSGAPVNDYHAKIVLTAVEDGTMIRWSASFTPKIPCTGWLVKVMIINTFNRFIDGIEKAF